VLDLKSLETFFWVATLKSFRGAAARLNTTQPSVSQRIRTLESQIGSRLLERDNRTVSVTAKGRQLLDYADRLMRLHTHMQVNIIERQDFRGVLRLGVAESIVQTWLPRFIERLDALYPQLQLEIDVDISRHLRDRLVEHEIDLAFLLGPVSAPAIRNLPLSCFPLTFLASPTLALPPPPVPLEALLRYPIITFARRTAPYIALRELIESQDFNQVRIHASTSLAPVIRLAVQGMGIALMPRAIVSEEISAGQLRVIETPVRIPDLHFTASWSTSPNNALVEVIAGLAIETAASSGHGSSSGSM
jgi:DNA-binding transcriptional LysR family regulator